MHFFLFIFFASINFFVILMTLEVKLYIPLFFLYWIRKCYTNTSCKIYIDNIELTVDDLSKKKVIVFLPVVKKIYAIIPVIVTLNKIIFLFFLNKFSKRKLFA